MRASKNQEEVTSGYHIKEYLYIPPPYHDKYQRGFDTINMKMIVSLTLIITFLATISGCIQQKNTIPINEKGTIYVGSRDGDYRTIQEAIDAAENGATIIVKNGSYNELITINKTITLMGEDKNTTIINFNPNYKISQVAIIKINANNCLIENLQITLSNNSVIGEGISINSKNTTIKNNIITKMADGIELLTQSESNTIINNEIKNNLIGIMTLSSNNNNISNNIFSNNNNYNIYLTSDSNNNKVSFNSMNDSEYGIRIKGSQNNKVYKNCIQNNQIGIYCCCSAQSNYFYNNTLEKNSKYNAQDVSGKINIWYDYPNGNGNYWSDYTGFDTNHDGLGDTPYKISNTGEEDVHPLIGPPVDAPCNK